jgi:hypothetical protein
MHKHITDVRFKSYRDIDSDLLREELDSRIKAGKMQYPFAAWGDFNKDGHLDVAFLFLGNETYQVVVFQGGSTESYTPVPLVKAPGRPHGIYYEPRRNTVFFERFGVATGNFRWNGRRYVITKMIGD